MPFREETLFQISWGRGLWHILRARGRENWHLHASVYKEISTTALLSALRRLIALRFVFILCLFCAYVFVLHIGCYHTLSMIVIYCINKYFIKSCFIQSVYVKDQPRNRDYLWMKPARARFDLPQNLGCIGISPTGKTTVRFAFIYNFHPWGQCHLVLPRSTFWGVGGWVFRKTAKWRFAWQFRYGRRPLIVTRFRSRPQALNFIKKETLALVFSCEFCEIFKNTFFNRTPPDDCFSRLTWNESMF